MQSYRQLLAHAQKLVPLLRPHMSPAWDMVSRWEELQPVTHRTPCPEPILKAMVGLAVALGWTRWAAAALAIFYFISRPGDVLNACREDLLTPLDILEERGYCVFPKRSHCGAAVVAHEAAVRSYFTVLPAGDDSSLHPAKAASGITKPEKDRPVFLCSGPERPFSLTLMCSLRGLAWSGGVRALQALPESTCRCRQKIRTSFLLPGKKCASEASA